MTLPPRDLLEHRLVTYLHADTAHAVEAGHALGSLAVDGDTWLWLCGSIAISAAVDTRLISPRPPGGFYSLDPIRAAHQDEAAILANQLVAAAANEDLDLMGDLLNAHLRAATEAGPTSPEQAVCARTLAVLLVLARTLHAERCPEAHR